MLRSLKDLEHYKVSASDGDIGSVVKFFIDDQRWVVRYLVVQAGDPLLEGRRVLISPISFGRADWLTQRFHVALTMERVKNSPSIDLDEPISRQHEQHYSRYYGFPRYWDHSGLWGSGAHPNMLAAGTETTDGAAEGSAGSSDDVHLRSDEEVRGYHVQGSDGAIGYIEDFIVDDETWEVRYLVVDTRNWWSGKNVLVAPQWASRISWAERKVSLDLPRKALEDSPEWNPAAAINRAYEMRLYDYYGRPAYWVGRTKPAAAVPPAPESPAEMTEEMQTMRLSDEDLRGRTIIAADGQVVGEVTALFLDSEVWQVESLQVHLRKDIADLLGAERSMFHAGTLEVPVRMVQSVGETIVLSVPVEELREAAVPKDSGHGAEGITPLRRPHAPA